MDLLTSWKWPCSVVWSADLFHAYSNQSNILRTRCKRKGSICEEQKTSPFLSSTVSFSLWKGHQSLFFPKQRACSQATFPLEARAINPQLSTVNQQKLAFLLVKVLHSFRLHCSSCSNHLSPLRDLLLEVALFAIHENVNILFCIPILITPCPFGCLNHI